MTKWKPKRLFQKNVTSWEVIDVVRQCCGYYETDTCSQLSIYIDYVTSAAIVKVLGSIHVIVIAAMSAAPRRVMADSTAFHMHFLELQSAALSCSFLDYSTTCTASIFWFCFFLSRSLPLSQSITTSDLSVMKEQYAVYAYSTVFLARLLKLLLSS